MAPIKDLTFDQVSTALGTPNAFFVGEDPLGNITLLVSVAAINGDSNTTIASQGVIKFFTKLREACHKAQESLNASQAEGEKLNSFPAAVSNGTIVDGFVEQTSMIKSKIAVSTATEIIGTNI